MKRKKEQWKPKVTSYREVTENNETKLVEFDPASYTIPAGHSVYITLVAINETRLEEQTA
ncbi:BOW99_gp33 family protein [Streptococcus lutetiensis]|uniref:BOW99_gp33 family protein n=1 Tax=Streptococcus lutetiensis TaxID=150055 RepID=UPI001BDB683A|nr:hypothetical protein [Streptococcus lutetiensis]MBT0938719.1 hypothetical protein [Streptococcus lutetiensis]